MNHIRIARLTAPLIFVALAQLCSGQDCGPRPRLISVMGTAEINVAPDEAVLNLGVESRDKVLSVAKSQADERVKKVLALARAAGVEQKDIATSVLQMGPDYSEEKVPRLLGYSVSQTLAITLKDLSRYEALMTQLLEAGVNRVDNVSFRISEDRKYRDEARAKAIAAAREKAVAMASLLGQTVGKPWEISEQPEPNYNYVVQVAANAGENAAYDRPEESTVAPGQVTIRASVKVSFQLE